MLSKIASHHRVGLAAFSAILLALLAVAPVLADDEQGHTGTVGFHALRDKESKPGAICTYKGIYPTPGGYSYEGTLKRIDVRPPRVRAIQPLSGSQEVGWRFIVQRRTVHFDPISFGPWAATYKSSIQRDFTNAVTDASFSMRSVDVNVPSSGADDDPNYEYRVLVKMFWFTHTGGTMGTATHLVEWYRHVLNNFPIPDPPNHNDKTPCDAWEFGDL